MDEDEAELEAQKENLAKEKAKKEAEDELKKVPKLLEEDDMLEPQDDDEDDDKPKLSKRKLKKLTRLSVAELKQLVTR